MKRLVRPSAFAFALCVLAACGPRPPATTPSGATAVPRGLEVVSLHGHVALDPRAEFQYAEGDAFLHVYSLDGVVFDGMLCYPRPDRCEVLDVVRGNEPRAWSATLSESLPSTTPFTIAFDVPPDGEWRHASRVDVRVVAPGLGQIGATTLATDAAPPPPIGVRERLRGEQRLRRVYESLAMAYRLADPADRAFPPSHAEAPSPPPCRPTWVYDADDVAWLGLSAPVVVSWAFSIEADPIQGTLRVIARRDLTCHGDEESLVLRARLDEDGDFERMGIERVDVRGARLAP